MQDVISFISALFSAVCDFMLAEPISYFTGILILCGVVALVKRIIS